MRLLLLFVLILFASCAVAPVPLYPDFGANEADEAWQWIITEMAYIDDMEVHGVAEEWGKDE